jgi:hypothetical protein
VDPVRTSAKRRNLQAIFSGAEMWNFPGHCIVTAVHSDHSSYPFQEQQQVDAFCVAIVAFYHSGEHREYTAQPVEFAYFHKQSYHVFRQDA